MDISAFLKDTREAANVSLPDLAALAGVPQASLAAFERGSRAPRVDQLDQILAGLGLQLRVEAEPLWAEVDAAIDAAAALEPVQRLAGLAIAPLALLSELRTIPCVLEGLCAAVLWGAPVSPAVIDLVLPLEDEVLERFRKWAAFCARRWSNRWRTFGFAVPDPRESLDPLRYQTDYGELRLRLTDSLPEAVTMELGDLSVRVLDLRLIEASDPVAGAVIERLKQRVIDAGN